jgi:hypothetical protein
MANYGRYILMNLVIRRPTYHVNYFDSEIWITMGRICRSYETRYAYIIFVWETYWNANPWAY